MHCKLPFVRFVATVASGFVCSTGCEEPPRPSPEVPVVATAPAEAAMPTIDVSSLTLKDPTPAFPGFATGRVMDEQGKPIAVEGVRISVMQTGLLDETQAKVEIPVEPNESGVYVARLKPGTYLQPKARIEFTFNGNRYRLPLSPHGGMHKRQEASEGVVQDFVWKLEGPRPGETADKSRPETFIGGTITPEFRSFRSDLKRVIKSPPHGTKVQLTLIPKSPLADGSSGQARVVNRLYNPTQTALIDAPILDLPLAMWEVRGEEIFPDNTRSPLLFLNTDNSWRETVSGTFSADLAASALKPVLITFTRKE